MNFKKLKRLMCVLLSGTMILSTGMTGFAAETTQMGLVTEENEAPGKEALKDGLDANADSSSDRSNARAAVSPADLTVGDCENHVAVAVKRQAPTCFTEGIAAHYTCNACHKLYKTKASAEAGTGEVELESLKIAKLNHNAVLKPSNDADCTTPGNNAYFTCEICGRKYRTVEDVYKDVENKDAEESTCLSEEEIENEITLKALGHSYVREQGEETESTVAVAGWEQFDPVQYEAGTACGLTASRSCTRCTYGQQATDVSVELVEPEDGSYDCTSENGIDVAYKIEATFTNEEEDPSSTGQTTDVETVTETKHVTGHSYKYQFAWPEDPNSVFVADEEGKLALSEENKVVLKRACAVCKQEDTDADSVEAELTADGVAEGYTLKCYSEQKRFTAAAAFDDGQTHTDVKLLTLPVGKHSLKSEDYQAATCTAAGHEAYYYCSNTSCGKKFWDEEGTEVGENESVDIPALGHNITPPKYAFVEGTNMVSATFECMRKDECSAVVSKLVPEDNVDWDNPEKEDEGVTCNTEIDVLYPVSIPFDRNVVKQDETGKWYEDMTDKNYNAAFIYNGKAPRKEKVQHELTVTYEWAGTPETGEDGTQYYNPDDGVIATLTCAKCGGVAKIGTEGVDVSVEGDATEISLAEGAKLTLGDLVTDHDDYLPANCSAGGMDVYSVSLTGNTGDDAATSFEETGVIKNNTKKSGHKYIVSKVQKGTYDSVNNAPVIASMHIDCDLGENCPDHDTVGVDYTAENPGSVSVSFQEVTGEEAAGDLTQATCTADGYRVWTAAITMADGGKAYASYAEDGTGELVIVSEEVKATGHDFDVTLTEADWDWTEFGTEDDADNFVPSDEEGAMVYATYTCQNTNCGGEEHKGTEPATDGTRYGTGTDGKRYKRVGVAPTNDNNSETDCSSGKTITYTAAIDSASSTRTQTIAGHEWNDIEWGKWTDAQETENITLAGGKEFPQEVYTITASRQCRNCSEKQTFSTDADADGNVITIDTDRPPTEANTCTSPGSTIYWATLTLQENGGEVEIENPLPGVHVYPATGHNYQISWTWTAKVKNADGATESKTEDDIASSDTILEYTGAAASKQCANCQKLIAINTNYGDNGVRFTPPSGKIQCTATDVFTYMAQAQFVDDEDDVYTDTRRVIHQKKDRHNYSWTLSSWDETAQTVTVTAKCDDNEEHTFTVDNVVLAVTKQESIDATCISGPKTSVTGTFTVTDPKENKAYEGSGTFASENAEGIDRDKHAYAPVEINWEKAVLKEVCRDDTNVVYETEVTATCTLNNEHTEPVTVVATAPVEDIKAIDCSTDYNIHYSLAFKDADAADKKGLTLAEDSKTVSHEKSSHTLKRVAGSVGSCTEPGWKTHYHCEVCGNNYTSTSGATKVDVETTDPLGHLYGDPVFEWVKEGETARAIFTCTRSGCTTSIAGHTKVVAAEVNTDEDSIYKEGENGCVDSGKKLTYYYMVSYRDEDGNLYEDDLAKIIPNTDHNFSGEGGVCVDCGKQGLVKVSFSYKNNGADVVISAAWHDKDAAIEVPSAPNRPGYTFDGWSINGTKADDIDSAITAAVAAANAGDTINVTALYNVITTPGTVTVKYLDDAGKDLEPDDANPKEDTYPGTVGKNVAVTVKEQITVDGEQYVFSHWTKASQGTALSTNLSYDVYLASDAPVTVYAVYKAGSTPQTPVPVVAMADIYKFTESGVNKLAFTTTMSVPEGYTVTESGILYSVDETLEGKSIEELNESIVLNGTKVNKSVLNGAKTNLLSMKITPTNESRKIYARGYMICTNEDDESVVYYSDSAFSSYADAPSLATAQTAN